MQQNQFFQYIKRKLEVEKDSDFKSRIASILKISESGAYKKINSITMLTFNEASSICDALNLDFEFLDTKNQTSINPFIFHCDDLIFPPQTYEQWASNILNHSLELDQYKQDYNVFFFQNAISYFHLLPFRYLLYFKLYTWNRSAWKIQTIDTFSIAEFRKNHALNSLLDKIYDHYVSYESIEIWHVDFLNGILSQIKYYYKLKIFENLEDLKLVIKDLYKLIAHLKKIAELAQKRNFGKNDAQASIQVFVNYTHSSSNLMFIKAPAFKMIYNSFLNPNYLRSSDEDVCNYAEQWLSKTISQSELISGSGEIARNKFFDKIEDRLVSLEKELIE